MRTEREMAAIRSYIRNNPAKWARDRDNAAKGLPKAATVDDYLREAGT